MPLLICPDCGMLVPDARQSRNRCEPCAHKLHQAQRIAWEMKFRLPHTIICLDCGVKIENAHGLRKRCPECVKKENNKYKRGYFKARRAAKKRATIICLDCGAAIENPHGLRKRCQECAKKKWYGTKPVRTCLGCGIALPSNHCKRCAPCSEKHERERNTQYNREHYNRQPPKPMVCSDCGDVFTPLVNCSRTKRCPKCRHMKVESYYLIRDMRRDFANMALTDPIEARRIEEAMRLEEGEDFTELALDGLPEKMRDGLLVAARSYCPQAKPKREKTEQAVKALEEARAKVEASRVKP